jgi:hypothetical protein
MTSMKKTKTQPVVYIDSDVEQQAWLVATFGPIEGWRTMSQTLRHGSDGQPLEVLEIQLATGDTVSVPFAEAAPDESLEGEGYNRTEQLDDLMSLASQYAEQNPPNHPGSLPRFPIPARAYKEAVSIPMAVLAVDDLGRRGLYAPPRQVAISIREGKLVGVGEFPGFDPENPDHWPPPRLGDWPPASISELPKEQLKGIIARFNACWSRVLEAWFSNAAGVTPVLQADVEESLRYRHVLDLPAFDEYYERLNPVFAKWLRDIAGNAGD